MKIFETNWADALTSPLPVPGGAVASIGNYDGVHRGQREILAGVVREAWRNEAASVLITFEPHPLTVLDPPRAPLRLLSPEQKRRLVAAVGISHYVELQFDAAFAEVTAETFLREFLVERLEVREVRVGSRFGFGRGKRGDLALLSSLGEELGYRAVGVSELLDDGMPVSSSRIRTAVAEGRVDLATRFLGRPFALQGTIVEGQRQGRGLGWPTINLKPVQSAIPARGVYVSEVRFEGDRDWLPAVANVGVRPTLTEGVAEVVEAHILDFSADVYGKTAELAFLSRLRPERGFDSAEALKQQIADDVESARAYFDTAHPDPIDQGDADRGVPEEIPDT